MCDMKQILAILGAREEACWMIVAPLWAVMHCNFDLIREE